MYMDYPPHRTATEKVLVLEGTETDPEEVIEMAISECAYLDHPEDGRIFYVVFLDTPKCVDPMTERALRQAIDKQAKRVLR